MPHTLNQVNTGVVTARLYQHYKEASASYETKTHDFPKSDFRSEVFGILKRDAEANAHVYMQKAAWEIIMEEDLGIASFRTDYDYLRHVGLEKVVSRLNSIL